MIHSQPIHQKRQNLKERIYQVSGLHVKRTCYIKMQQWQLFMTCIYTNRYIQIRFKLVHTLLLLVLLLYYVFIISGIQQNEEIKDEVNVQPHAMKGTSCIILCVYLTGIYRR